MNAGGAEQVMGAASRNGGAPPIAPGADRDDGGPGGGSSSGSYGDSSGDPSCRNCGATLVGPWCAQCGQRARDLDRPFLSLAGEFLENVLSFDGRAARTLGLLLFRPGELSRRYLDGRRASFVPPVRLLVIVLFVFFLTLELSGTALVQFRLRPAGEEGSGVVSIGAGDARSDLDLVFLAPPAPAGASRITAVERRLDALAREGEQAQGGQAAGLALARRLVSGFERAIRDPAPLNAFLGDWLPRVLFLMIPVFALLLKLSSPGRRYFAHLIFALHVHAFLFLATTLLIPLRLIGHAPWIGDLLPIGAAVYLLLAMKRFHGGGWFATLSGFVLLVAVYTVLLGAALGALLLIGVARV